MSELNITKENFEKEVLQSEQPVLVDFWATWCGPCQMLMPTVKEIATEVKHAKVCKINIDEQPELAQQFHVMSIPTLMVLKEGKVVSSSVGVRPKAEILKMLSI